MAIRVPGVRLGVAQAGIKKSGKDDLTLIELAPGSAVAGVFTQNAFCAAPVHLARAHQAKTQGAIRYWLTNTGNANAGTGEAGMVDARRSCSELAALTETNEAEIMPFSTGVIGEPLPIDRLCDALPAAIEDLREDGWERAALAILTTDTRAKLASCEVEIDGKTVTLAGMAKGAGMICPNMATMLAYVTTDARVDALLLQTLMQRAVDASFNRITVDGDTSTNDAAVVAATGVSAAEITANNADVLAYFEAALTDLCLELAQGIVRDGEGATKFVEVAIEGGKTVEECDQVAYTIAHSPLVKTALFASDPNWGRLLAAIGRAGLSELDVNGVAVHINDVLIAEGGARAASYTEEAGVAAMAPTDLRVRIDLGRGGASSVVWTTDFSYDYVKINAEYRT
jgi:glutamate N-acetyltransferase/amino-acid N-acetyltransferase